jgi:plasmid stabilization system protein ParE
VIFTPLAERHIDSLHEYIAMHASEERADGYVGRIVDFCNGLSTFPLRGTQRDDLLPGLRVTGFERRVTIAFIVTADAVLIESVLCRRTLLSSLREGLSYPSQSQRKKGIVSRYKLTLFQSINK